MTHAEASTSQRPAAASTSIQRAVAPARRSGIQPARTLLLPPAYWLPYRFSSRSACSTRTSDQSASSSSAMSIASAVRDPCPMSGRGTVIVTMSSAPM
ncbi:MAG: hypothetical protein Q8W46_03845 [Candidatus Palauibacterales bacterium]|nr:hypothetical protein [Candidatus Palauibacterales bacterium]